MSARLPGAESPLSHCISTIGAHGLLRLHGCLTPHHSERFLACAAAAVLAGGGYWLAKRSAEPVEATKAVRFAVLPAGFAFEGAASRQSFALLPDGARLAFTAMDSSGAFTVFLRDFDSLEARLVPGSEGAHTVFWPP